jgi:dipeptidyl aminopeptidase/acylaminoacyl peptidase
MIRPQETLMPRRFDSSALLVLTLALVGPGLAIAVANPRRPNGEGRLDPGSGERKPITHESLWRLKSVGAPVPSPDGKWVVVSVTEPAYDEKDEVSDLWIVAADGSAPPRRLTSSKGSEGGAAWSPDASRLAFTARRDGDEANQIYVRDLSGGEAQRLTRLTLGARGPKWSPDGTMIAFQSATWPGAADEAANKTINEERKNAKTKVRAYDGFPIRSWDRWLDERQTHLFLVSVDDGSKVKDLLAGTKLVASPGFRGRGGEGGGDDLAPAWAPDGRSIVITASLDSNIAAYAEPTTQLFAVPLAGGEPTPLTSGDVSRAGADFSPDGRTMCFDANAGRGTIYAVSRVECGAWPWSGQSRIVTGSFDRAVGDFAFTPDSRTLVLNAEDQGFVRLFSVPVAGGTVTPFLEGTRGVFRGLDIPERAATPAIFATWETAVSPGEVTRIDLASKKQTPLTSFNTAAAAAIDWQPLRELWTTTKEGRRIHSFLALPPGFDEHARYPLLVLVHGGHASMWTDSITKRWNYHLLAAPGYVVLLSDYRGSTGYGEKFTLDILGDPLRGPADDVNAAADDAIRRFPFIDGSRQAAAGASYGGHLVNWLEATTTRYKCLVSHAGLASLYAQWSTSDGIYHRADDGRAVLGQPEEVARPEPHELRERFQDADAAVGGRERLPGAAQQRRRDVVGAAADEGPVSLPRLARRQPLDPEGRGQPPFLRRGARLAEAMAVKGRGRPPRLSRPAPN